MERVISQNVNEMKKTILKRKKNYFSVLKFIALCFEGTKNNKKNTIETLSVQCDVEDRLDGRDRIENAMKNEIVRFKNKIKYKIKEKIIE